MITNSRLVDDEGWNCPEPQLSTFHVVLNALQFSGKQEAGKKAVSLIKLMLKESNEGKDKRILYPSTQTFDLALTACRKGRYWKGTLQLIDIMKENHISFETRTFNEILISLSKNCRLDVVIDQHEQMKLLSVKPDVVTYNTLISAYSNSGKPREALNLFNSINLEPTIFPDIVTYTCAMRAYIKEKKEESAIILFETLQDKKMKLDVYAYACVIDACAKSNKWRKALDYLDEMRRSGIEPNAVAYSAAINACGNGAQWRVALDLLYQVI